LSSTCYQLTGTDVNGCVDRDTICVTLEQAPVISFTTANLCEGQTANFINTTTGAVSYLWSFGDGTPTSTATSPQHIYNGTGTYTVELTATSPAGCTSVSQQDITVNYVPTPLFTADVLEGCPPFTTNFTNQTDSIDP